MAEHRDRKVKEMQNVPKKLNRKSYVKPQLTEYGHMEKLTGGAAGTGPEGGFLKRRL
jgi:hypothetical protein